MKSKLHIKGSTLWKVCALLILGISLTCCFLEVTNLEQPVTATAGQVIPITLHDSIATNINTPNYIVANYVYCFLAPKGWAAAQNATVTYTSSLGNGSMQLMPSSSLEPTSVGAGTNLTWPAACAAKFGLGKNLVNDVEWVVFESKTQITIDNTITLTGNINMQLKVGADGNNTSYFPEYITCESVDGLNDDDLWDASHPYWTRTDGACLVQAGTDGDLNDYCNPQLVAVNPPKALDNEFITITYNNKLITTPLSTHSDIYLCVDTAYTSDGKALTGFCVQNAQSQLIQTSAASGLYNLTIWPRSYFGITGTTTLTELVYHITDGQGNNRVGYGGNPNVAFTYKFKCN